MRALLFSLLLLGACATTPPAGDILTEMRALEMQRGQANRADDEAALSRIYTEDFRGVTASGATVTRMQLFATFARTHVRAPELLASSRSEVLTATRDGANITVTGRLHFGNSDSLFTHYFRRRGDHWELFSAVAVPITSANWRFGLLSQRKFDHRFRFPPC
jgi:hypothetical protein